MFRMIRIKQFLKYVFRNICGIVRVGVIEFVRFDGE